MRKSTKDQ